MELQSFPASGTADSHRNGSSAMLGGADSKHLMGEMIELFSTLSVSDQRSVLKSISGLTSSPVPGSQSRGSKACLTSREKQVLILLTHGYTRREIGNSLNISLNTASRHIANIYRKIDISTVAEATRWSLSAGLI